MNPIFTLAVFVLAIAQLALPVRLKFVPLLVGMCHLPNISILGVGGADFSVSRLLIGLGVVQAVIGRRLRWSLHHRVDRLMVAFALAAIITSFGHSADGDSSPLVFSLGLIYNFVGAYVYVRSYVPETGAVTLVAKALVLVLLPLAALMLVQTITQQNPYALLGGGISDISNVRGGRIRAQGPFAHPITAGTVGASALPLMVALWRTNRGWAYLGMSACAGITVTSASSGPLMTMVAACGALMLWRVRGNLQLIRRSVLLMLLALHLVMKAPVWYLMARIDLTGSSTGWHRAELITAALKHLEEWWLYGTDYTVHWMPTGVSWSPNHTDITNHYLQMGVVGGLPLLLAFIAVIAMCFKTLGSGLDHHRNTPAEFTLWCIGAMLFAHSFTFLSVSYFDQSAVWITFALALAAAGDRVHGPTLSAANSEDRDWDSERAPAI